MYPAQHSTGAVGEGHEQDILGKRGMGVHLLRLLLPLNLVLIELRGLLRLLREVAL